MSEKNDYVPAGQYAPISAWGYVGYNILFCIPIVGLICLIVFSFSAKNINRRSYARSFWCTLVIGAICTAIILAVTGVGLGQLADAMNSVHH